MGGMIAAMLVVWFRLRNVLCRWMMVGMIHRTVQQKGSAHWIVFVTLPQPIIISP